MRAISLRYAVIGAAAVLAACSSGQPHPGAMPPLRPFEALVAQRVVVTPTFSMAVAGDLDWGRRIGRSREVRQKLDSSIASALDARGVKKGWIFPDRLASTYAVNPTYAADPYNLGMEPLRSPQFKDGSRIPEPLASQLRTMVALDDGRFVIAPVELRFEHALPSTTAVRAVLRVALLDARLAEARWVGEVSSDTASTFSPAMTASLAEHLADLFAAP